MFKNYLYYFMSVVENGSFSGAAKKHLLSQSAISQQITKLEEDLGFTLFNRTSYRPVLTPAGKYYYDQLKSILLSYEKIEKKAKKMDEKDKKEIHVGITGPFEEKHIPIIMRSLPVNCDVKVKIYSFQECVDLLENGQLDIAFGIANDFQNHSLLHYEKVYSLHTSLVCSKDHAFASLPAISMKDIQKVKLISLSRKTGNQFYRDLMKTLKSFGVVPHIVKEEENLRELLLDVKMNEGVALLSKEVIEDKELVCIPITDNPYVDFVAAYHIHNPKEQTHRLYDAFVSYFKTL